MEPEKTYQAGYEHVLSNIIPETAVKPVADYLIANHIYLEVCDMNKHWGKFHRRGLISKSGKEFKSRITINSELRPYAALLVLLHEIAHHRIWVMYELLDKKVRPHGPEWVKEYKTILQSCMDSFPPEVHTFIVHMMCTYYSDFENRIIDKLQKIQK